jgi:hypothetical protein
MSAATHPQQAQPASLVSAHAVNMFHFAKLDLVLKEIGAPHLLSIFVKFGINDSNLEELSQLRPEKLSELFSMTEETSIGFIQKYRILSMTPPSETSPMHDFSHERALWYKGCLILEACTKGARPFVGSVMERLLKKTIENVQKDITRDLDTCDVEEWDCSFCVGGCSTCGDAANANFTEEGPVRLKIRAIDSKGIAQCSEAHCLKPHIYVPCRLKNISSGFFSDSDAISSSVPLLICPNPVDLETPRIHTSEMPKKSKKKDEKAHIPTVILLRQINLDRSKEYLTPFRVTRCVPSEPVLQFDAVLCHSLPSVTAKLVNYFLKRQSKEHGGDDPPLPFETRGFSHGFWALTYSGTEYAEFKLYGSNCLKPGNTVRFSGSDLPPGIISGCQYIVKVTTNWSFDVCGPIVCPVLPFAADASACDDSLPYIIKRSPVGRYRRSNAIYTPAVISHRTCISRVPLTVSRSGYATLLGSFIHEDLKLNSIGLASEPTAFQTITASFASFSAVKPAAS